MSSRKHQPSARPPVTSIKQHKINRFSPPLGVVWGVAVGLAIWSMGFTSMLNSDIWFHLGAGRQIVSDRGLPAADAWSFTAAGTRWHNHEWLADVGFYFWSAAGGVDSLVYWEWILLLATYLLLFESLRRLASSTAAGLLAVFAAAVAQPFFDIRPHLYT